MVSRTNLIFSGLLILSLAACGGSSKEYLIPVDAPGLKPFQSPEADEFDDEDEWGEEESEESESEPDEVSPAEPADASKPAGGGGAVKATVKDGGGTTMGDLGKDVIQATIRRKLGNFRLCYERELLRDPKLAGTVKVVFEIKPNGTVTDVASSGLAVVDSCVGKVMATIQFPKPKGGGIVKVTYPFAFSPGS